MFGVQRQASERILQKLQEHPDAWTRVDSVLEHSKSQQAKFYALQVRHVLQASTLLTFPGSLSILGMLVSMSSMRSAWQP